MLGTGGNIDVREGSFISLACLGHRYYIGGGKPPPPTVPLMLHTGALDRTERVAHHHRPVRQRCGEEATKIGRRGDAGEFEEDLPVLCKTA